MSEIRNLTRNGETFYPLTHEKAVIGMEDFKDTITTQIEQYEPIQITGDVTNAPDEEDITADSNNLLKFKNRNNLYGLGKVILRRGSSFASQVTLANTIYVIQYNFDLDSARINVPNGSILLFEGGTLSNGTLVCADLYDVRLVYYQDQSEILSGVTLEGNFIHKACDKDTIREILVDNSSITKDANDVLSVKEGGIQNTHLNGNVVDNSSISLDTNNKISIKDGGVTGNKLNSGIVNADDLSIVNNKIQLSNRGTTDGIGKVILRRDQSFASQLTQTNTIYVILYNFTLTSNVTIPADCILEFDGGSISGAYTLTGTNTGIRAELVKIFNTDVTLAGTWNIINVYPEWFGATGINDDYVAIQKALMLGANHTVVFSRGRTYKMSYRAEVFSNTELIIDGVIENINYGGFALFSTIVEHGGYTGYHDIYIHGNGTIDQKGQNGSGLQPAQFCITPISLGHNYNITIEGITLKNWRDGHHAIEVTGSKNVLIKNVKFLGVLNEIDGEQCEAIQIEDVKQGGTTAIPYDGTTTKDVVIDGCVFSKSDECPDMVVAIGDHSGLVDPTMSDDSIFSNITIKNCIFKDINYNSVNGDMWILRFRSSYKNLVIKDNRFENIERFIIELPEYSEHIAIEGNYIKKQKNIPGFDEYIISLKNAHYVNFVNNIIDDVYESVLNIKNCSNINIKNNIFKDNGISTIFFSNTASSNVVICNNSFINCGCLSSASNSYPVVWIQIPVTSLRIFDNFVELAEHSSKPFHLPSTGWSSTILFKDNMIANATNLTTRELQDLYEQLSRFGYISESASMGGYYTMYYTDNPNVTTKGPTSNRPKAWLSSDGFLSKDHNIGIGYRYFDTDLNKPIYVKDIDSNNNVIWVDATGAQV